MSRPLTLVDFALDEARCRGYASAADAVEVFFASRDEPVDTGFTWAYLPGGKGPRARRWLALAHALRRARSQQWAIVHPGWTDMLFLAWLARRRGKPLEFWLGESQGLQWFTFLILRAFGSQSEATHWRTGLAAIQAEARLWDK